MKFCTICAVNMFQNMTMHRLDKKIRKADLPMIRAASILPFFGGGLKHISNSKNNFGHIRFICLQGMADGRAQVKWSLRNDVNPLPTASNNFCSDTLRSSLPHPVNSFLDPSTICGGLRMGEGELMVIVEWNISPPIRTPKGAKDHYKFLVLQPKPLSVDESCFFDTLTPFSPKPGIVTTSAPN